MLYAYLAVTNYAVSLVFVRNEDRVQRLVDYVSKSLLEAETRYLPLEKVVLAIVHAAKKFPHYFQAHTVLVLTQLPLQTFLWKLDYTGRIAKRGTMLGAYDVKYIPLTTIKGQVVAHFVADFTEGIIGEEEKAVGVVLTSAIIGPP